MLYGDEKRARPIGLPGQVTLLIAVRQGTGSGAERPGVSVAFFPKICSIEIHIVSAGRDSDF